MNPFYCGHHWGRCPNTVNPFYCGHHWGRCPNTVKDPFYCGHHWDRCPNTVNPFYCGHHWDRCPNTVEDPFYCGHHWDRCPNYRGVPISMSRLERFHCIINNWYYRDFLIRNYSIGHSELSVVDPSNTLLAQLSINYMYMYLHVW